MLQTKVNRMKCKSKCSKLKATMFRPLSFFGSHMRWQQAKQRDGEKKIRQLAEKHKAWTNVNVREFNKLPN